MKARGSPVRAGTLRFEKGGAKAKKSFAEQQIGKEGEGKSLAEGDF